MPLADVTSCGQIFTSAGRYFTYVIKSRTKVMNEIFSCQRLDKWDMYIFFLATLSNLNCNLKTDQIMKPHLSIQQTLNMKQSGIPVYKQDILINMVHMRRGASCA